MTDVGHCGGEGVNGSGGGDGGEWGVSDPDVCDGCDVLCLLYSHSVTVRLCV